MGPFALRGQCRVRFRDGGGEKQRRRGLALQIQEAVDTEGASDSLKATFGNWVQTMDNYDKCGPHVSQIERLLPKEKDRTRLLNRIHVQMDMLRPQSHWLIGGDGWAYDIGFNGLDHVLSKLENVNILVLDTEMYSNTGGQVSKSSNKSAVMKFAQKGKTDNKKDLGRLAMQYETVYVASVALGSNYNQTLQAFREAESYKGPSLIIAYSPCIDWGMPSMKHMMEAQKTATEAGVWKLYRFDPRLAEQGLPPLQLDSQKVRPDKMEEILNTQNRFAQLRRKDEALADEHQGGFKQAVTKRHEAYTRMSLVDEELLDYLKAQVGEQTSEKTLVLYTSETGTAQNLAKEFGGELKRRGLRVKVCACDDYDFEKLQNESSVMVFAATCGQGEIPENGHEFWKYLNDENLPADHLKGVKFGVFALGDTGYAYFNKVGKDFDERLAALGGERLLPVGLGDDKDDEKWETAFIECEPDLYNQMQLPEPPAELGPPTFNVTLGGTPAPDASVIVPVGAKLLEMNVNEEKMPPDSDRDIRHYEVNLAGTGVTYNTGDSMGVYPFNAESKVLEFLEWYGADPDTALSIEDPSGTGKFPIVATTPRQLLTQCLDLFGRPGRKFYNRLEMVASDSAEKAQLAHLMSKEGKNDLLGLISETTNHAEVMKMFPSAKPPMEYLVEFLPPIKQRLYSIASAPSMDGDQLHMCIVADDWLCPSGKYGHGLTTGHLAGRAGHGPSPMTILGKINPATFALPSSLKQPILMVGLGTGIAPCRALIRDRMHFKAAGEEIGPMMLYFGVRTKRVEYTYGDELDELHDNGKGPLTHLLTAFSRDQKEKIYCQNRITESSKLVYEYLVNQNGYYLLCGPGGPPVKACRKALEEAFVKHGGMSEVEANDYVTQMQIEGRYNEELW